MHANSWKPRQHRLVATSLTFGNHLEFGQDSCHTSKGRPTFLPRERKRERASEALCEPHNYWEGPSMGLARAGASPWRVVERRPSRFLTVWGLGINILATSLGIDERLAFRGFDKTIIFRHWLSKTQKLALASGAFLLKKAFTIS